MSDSRQNCKCASMSAAHLIYMYFLAAFDESGRRRRRLCARAETTRLLRKMAEMTTCTRQNRTARWLRNRTGCMNIRPRRRWYEEMSRGKCFLLFSYLFEVLCEANVMGTHYRNFHVLHGGNCGDDE